MKLLLVSPESPLAAALIELLKSRGREAARLDPALNAGAMSAVLAQHRDDMVIDRATVTKWGFQIGTLIISFQRTAAQIGGQKAAE